jgi:hypothetical protein
MRVFQIQGDDSPASARVVFSLHPLGALSRVAGIEIDRELAFVSGDGGQSWRAEG